MTSKNQRSGPPSPPQCEHGRTFSHHSQCPECRGRDEKIKALVHPLVDEWWKSKGQNISLYHYIFQAYHMGMRKEHLKWLAPCPNIDCKKPRGEEDNGPCPHCGDKVPF